MRLIDADKICYYRNCNSCTGEMCEYCDDYIADKSEIDNAPTIERPTKSEFLRMAEQLGYEKVIHAEWNFDFEFEDDRVYRCSNCGGQAAFNGRHIENDLRYCHYCGAKMYKEKEQ